jgi:hypothetical protein
LRRQNPVLLEGDHLDVLVTLGDGGWRVDRSAGRRLGEATVEIHASYSGGYNMPVCVIGMMPRQRTLPDVKATAAISDRGELPCHRQPWSIVIFVGDSNDGLPIDSKSL